VKEECVAAIDSSAPGWTPGADCDSRGEGLDVDIKLVVSPANGINRPDDRIDLGTILGHGDQIGEIVNVATSTPVICRFAGRLIARLALEGERVDTGQPIAWLEVEAGDT
jgi:hypothetical protein